MEARWDEHVIWTRSLSGVLCFIIVSGYAVSATYYRIACVWDWVKQSAAFNIRTQVRGYRNESPGKKLRSGVHLFQITSAAENQSSACTVYYRKRTQTCSHSITPTLKHHCSQPDTLHPVSSWRNRYLLCSGHCIATQYDTVVSRPDASSCLDLIESHAIICFEHIWSVHGSFLLTLSVNVIRDKRLWCNGTGTHYAHWQVPAGDSRGVHDVIDTHGRAFTSPSGQVVGLVYHLLDRREGGGGPAGFRVYFFTFRVVCIIPCDGMPSSFHPEYLICVRNNHRLRG